jgi:glycosyltransferase involved in cell wall biosynthesis
MEKQFKEQPLVSVIMNCYNGATYLDSSIKSVLSQTYKNWELIFWDNKSEDESAKIFKHYKDKRLKYFYAKEHTSLYKARNLAIKETSGELLAFIDTDDLWHKEKLEIQVPFFKDKKISLVYCNQWIIKKNLEKKKIFIKKKSPSGFIYEKLLEDYNVGIIAAIFRKNIINKNLHVFDERFSIIGDFDFFLKLSKSHYFQYVSRPLAYYRIHHSNLSSVFDDKQMNEWNIWFNENKDKIIYKKLNKLKIKVNFRRLLYFKFQKNYKSCFKILFKNYKSITFFKMVIITLMPLYILKKLSWFHL